MKFIVASDFHFDAVTAGVRRFEELERAAVAVVKHAIEAKVDAFLFLGDLCDPDTGSAVFRCVELAQRMAVKLAQERITSFWMAGNHDVIEDGTGHTTLTPMRSIEKWGAKRLFPEPGSILVVERWEHFIIDTGRDKKDHTPPITFAFLPYTATSHHYSPKDVMPTQAFHNAWRAQAPVVFAGHLSIPGIVPGEETHEMGRGRDMTFPYDEIIERRREYPTLMLNGHYHRQQHFRKLKDSRGIHIPGSMARLTFGEEYHAPGYLFVETRGHKFDVYNNSFGNKHTPDTKPATLLTIGESDPIWKQVAEGEAIYFGDDLRATIVRLRPPLEAEEIHVELVVHALRTLGVAAVKVLPRPSKAVLPAFRTELDEEGEPLQVAKRPYEVVSELVESANTRDRDALKQLTSEVMAKAGL
jgi:DNA repair exonuclease SbcCD nuclease subunit